MRWHRTWRTERSAQRHNNLSSLLLCTLNLNRHVGVRRRLGSPPTMDPDVLLPKTTTSALLIWRDLQGASHEALCRVSSIHDISTVSPVLSCAAAENSRVSLLVHRNHPWPAGRQADRVRCDLTTLPGQAGHCSASPEHDLGCEADTRSPGSFLPSW